jgi:hypothetical protein
MLVGHHQRNFDIDLRYGNDGEELVLQLLNGGKKVEVKTDRMAHKTGNVAIEFRCRGKLSGIATSEADYWALVLKNNELVIFIKTEVLKEICRQFYTKGFVRNGGDDNASEMIIVPLKFLTDEVLKFTS